MTRMASRHHAEDYEDFKPSLVIPDHFSYNQSSTIVIIYDEPLGSSEDELVFVFPGETTGGALKKIVPKRIDNRTFVIETPVYSTSKRSYLNVTPQLKFRAGDVIDLPDVKISLKHPVRNVMELCLGLSTQSAVLPVLLTLIMHSEQHRADIYYNGGGVFQDTHFDRIMATLVGSMEPGTKHLRNILLPEGKWKKMSVAEFAREFGMQEMEKQAYMVHKRGRERKKILARNYTDSHEDNIAEEYSVDPYSDYEEGEEPFNLISSSHLSTSTPEMNHLASSSNTLRDSLNKWSKNKKTKTLPKTPKKPLFDNRPGPKVADASQDGLYDPVSFDITEEDVPVTASPVAAPKKVLFPRLRDPIGQSQPIPLNTDRRTSKEEDTASLDSYEDMNENNVVQSITRQPLSPPTTGAMSPSSFMERGKPMSPPAERFPRGPVSPPYELERTPLSPPRMRGRSLHVDPSNRPQLPLPPNYNNNNHDASSSPSMTPQYSIADKKKKKQAKQPPLPEDRPLETPAKQTPPTTSKRPLPEPKPAALKGATAASVRGNRPHKKGVRSRDVYVKESESESEREEDNDLMDVKSVLHTGNGGGGGGRDMRPLPPEPLAINSINFKDDEHMYESAEVSMMSKKKKKGKGGGEPPPPPLPTSMPPSKTKYQNISIDTSSGILVMSSSNNNGDSENNDLPPLPPPRNSFPEKQLSAHTKLSKSKSSPQPPAKPNKATPPAPPPKSPAPPTPPPKSSTPPTPRPPSKPLIPGSPLTAAKTGPMRPPDRGSEALSELTHVLSTRGKTPQWKNKGEPPMPSTGMQNL